MASVGVPLNAEAVIWSRRALGWPFHDNVWRTETGGIMIADVAVMDLKPGSMVGTGRRSGAFGTAPGPAPLHIPCGSA
jgi:acyl-coenzyme A synthetase/AMP-(fatty) acid ligase